jgi:hypothetical protein
MTIYKDSDYFIEAFRFPMPPCTPPTLSDFDEDANTLIWANIVTGGVPEMRLYGVVGGQLVYWPVSLGAQVTP